VIILIGVGHIFQIRERLKQEIRAAQPGVVCIELDNARMAALLEQRRREQAGLSAERRLDWRTIGRGGLVMAFLVLMQERLARSYGSRAGDEMIAAWEAAREVGARAELIDLDSGAFFQKWMASLSMGERVRLMLSVVGGAFASRKRVEAELDQFYEDEDAFVRELAVQFPETKKALIDDRNVHMARGISHAQTTAPVVVAVVGEGHLAGIRAELLKAGVAPEGIRTISLRELTADGAPSPSGQGTPAPGSNAQFQVSYRAGPPPL
jgi:pheromone shutdown protein TraB